MSEALPDGGKLVTCDRDPKAVALAQSFFDRSPHGSKIEVRLGDALEQGGLIVGDNTLWSGRVLDPKSDDDHGIVAFNTRVTNDPRVDNVLLPVRDGVMVARKR